jgi:hypothetical protein
MMGRGPLSANRPITTCIGPSAPSIDGSPFTPIFDKLARTIAKLYPERVRTEIGSPYARIVVFEFNDDPRTTQDDLLHVARRSGREDGLSPCLSRRMLQVLAAVNEPAQPP